TTVAPKIITPPANQPALNLPPGAKGTELPKNNAATTGPAQSNSGAQIKRDTSKAGANSPPATVKSGKGTESEVLKKKESEILKSEVLKNEMLKNKESQVLKKNMSASSGAVEGMKSRMDQFAPRSAPAPKTGVSEQVLKLLPPKETAKGAAAG